LVGQSYPRTLEKSRKNDQSSILVSKDEDKQTRLCRDAFDVFSGIFQFTTFPRPLPDRASAQLTRGFVFELKI